MRLFDAIRWLTCSLRSGWSRNLLTSLGIAIGISAVTMLTGIGEGLRQYLMDSFSQFGSHLIAVTPGKVTTQGISAGILSTTRPLTLADAESMQRLPDVVAVVPVTSGTGELRAQGLTRNTDIIGVNHQGAEAWHFEVASGSFLPEDDSVRPRALAVLGSKLAVELFPTGTVLGRFIRVGDRRFRVVGVMEPKGQFLGFDLDDVVFIPVSHALSLFNREGLMEIDVVYRPSVTASQMEQVIRSHMIRRHGREDFTLYTQEDMLESLDDILNIIKSAIAGLGVISLLVGSVGIFTIMSIALQERMAEIGLLNALGAGRYQVMLLFLGEAVALSVMGGTLGLVLLGLCRLAILLISPDLPLVIHPLYLFLALLLSAIVGFISGLLPAWRAMRQDPVEALRGE